MLWCCISLDPQVCLLAVGDSQVWAGSFGIYIIDTVSVTCDKTLMEHHDLVSDMVLTEDNRLDFIQLIGIFLLYKCDLIL